MPPDAEAVLPAVPAHSTVPRWPAGQPRIDPGGRTYGVVSIGALARPIAEQWLTEIALTCTESWLLSEDAESLMPALSERLGAATTGLRLMAIGPEQDVLVVAAAARDAGLIDDELTLHVTSTTDRRVYCVHCKTTTSVAAAVGEVARCEGCGVGLLVFAHLSRRSGTYLGFMADAEERS